MNRSICLISPSLKMGGIESSLVILADFFVKSGFNIYFISCFSGSVFYRLNEKVIFIEPGFNHSGTFVSKLFFYPKISWFIRRNVKSTKTDVVLTFGDLFGPLVLLSLLGLKKQIYISDRISPLYNLKFPIPQLKKRLYPKSAGFIAQTRKAAEYKRKQFGDKLNLCIIPNALREVSLYPEIRRGEIILFVGRFSSEKGPERLIRAYKAIPDKKNWKLHMAGSGPEISQMIELVHEMDITDQVIFYGQVKDVDLLYAKAGIYVLPSLLEGFPNSLCEAMAAGLPCICYDSIPYEEILTDGVDGIVIKNDGSNKLTEELVRLINNPTLREALGNQALKIRTRLDIEKIGKTLSDFIFSR